MSSFQFVLPCRLYSHVCILSQMNLVNGLERQRFLYRSVDGAYDRQSEGWGSNPQRGLFVPRS